ncbi:MAG: hypothetical protein BZY88_12510 [SAR202 cluster bacterium Io17-Chloro-G9]|nr:MAG: hypothetical protein BZY88_12510 [SAR202 cluster bacterium Io17-Chloro-G9]
MNVNPAAIEVLQHGEIVSCQLTPAGSNYTFLAQVHLGEQTCAAIYKPRDGEAPLWDFPSGTLYKREYAAYLLSEVLGWNFIPFTIIRDGPYGIGSVQQYVDHDPRQNYYTLDPDESDNGTRSNELRTIACFDLVANSTDRKANHLIVGDDGKLWSIDHGLTFHADTKIRTVIWDFSGEPIPEHLLAELTNLAAQLENPQGQLQELLDQLRPEEVVALKDRVQWVLGEGMFPGLPGRRRRRYR